MSSPENVLPLGKEESFRFRCHPEVACFNECCRELELALTPYDVLRLCEKLNVSSAEFMDRHALIEFTDNHQFPTVYLGMVDDGRASCPFVTAAGCLVYQNRPGACRTYPVARGAAMGKGREIMQKYLLIREQHCLGHDDPQEQTIEEWEKDQEIKRYNHFNDMVMALTQHPKLRRGMTLSPEQTDLFISALYHLDTFRKNALFLDNIKLQQPQDDKTIDATLVLESAIAILAIEFFK